MSTIITRAGKGSPLTNNEMDQNLINLNTDKLEASDLTPYAPLASPTFTGDPRAPTPIASDNDTSIATTAYVTNATHNIVDNSVNPACTITQSGTGHCLVVADSTGDTTPFTIDNRGNACIGGTPSNTLWTVSNLVITSLGQFGTEGSNGIFMTSNGYRNTGGTWTSYGAGGSTGASQIGCLPTGTINFYSDATKADGSSVSPTIRMTLTNAGNLGIGTTNPSAGGFELNKALASEPHVVVATPTQSMKMGWDAGAVAQLSTTTNHPLRFSTNNTERMRIDTSGNVGIGTAAPQSKLHVVGPVRAGLQQSSISGTVMLQDTYSTTGSLATCGTNRSTGNFYAASGLRQNENAAGYGSSTGIDLWRSAIEVGSGQLAFKSTQTTITSAEGALVSPSTVWTVGSQNSSYNNIIFYSKQYVNTYLDTQITDDGTNAYTNFHMNANGVAGPAGFSILRGRSTFPALQPAADNTHYMGWSLARWAAVWAVNGTIQTSDERLKTSFVDFNEAELAVAKELAKKIGKYKWLEKVTVEGDAARTHVGISAQLVEATFAAHGLDAHKYGMFCFDDFSNKAKLPENVRDTAPDNRYSLRYEQLAMFICAGQEQRLAAIEATLSL